jgi:hypothetical protein
MKKIAFFNVIIFGWMLVFSSCSYSLKLSGASIPAAMKTISVDYFENTSALVVSYLSQQFTESLKDRIRSTTSLNIIRDPEAANANFSGTITDYSIAPASIQATNNNVAPVAGATRLTITVNVTFVNKIDKTLNFTQSFSAFKDYTGDLSSQEQNLITAINKQLTEDIFNRAFANWN